MVLINLYLKNKKKAGLLLLHMGRIINSIGLCFAAILSGLFLRLTIMFFSDIDEPILY